MSIKWSNRTQISRRVFMVLLPTIWQFYTASETYVGIKIVKTLYNNLLASIDLS
ncbi:hypothetical protein E2C01_010414 [Portunus trituberculatus]|uniref:Uncharacterized protein n=1 Tax=Portunus trituberculatus TaxID=210409 RepID=A0A5B7D8K0_PORTR|nr:hypothetical protein [Portunus trituberculatus]